jgi:mRNA interferase MazF
VVISRGSVCWVDLGPARGSRPAKARPVLVVQDDAFNASRLATTLVTVLTSNTELGSMPGNVFVPAGQSGLPKDSVANVTALVTVDKADLSGPVGRLPDALMQAVGEGLRLVLGLGPSPPV